MASKKWNGTGFKMTLHPELPDSLAEKLHTVCDGKKRTATAFVEKFFFGEKDWKALEDHLETIIAERDEEAKLAPLLTADPEAIAKAFGMDPKEVEGRLKERLSALRAKADAS